MRLFLLTNKQVARGKMGVHSRNVHFGRTVVIYVSIVVNLRYIVWSGIRYFRGRNAKGSILIYETLLAGHFLVLTLGGCVFKVFNKASNFIEAELRQAVLVYSGWFGCSGVFYRISTGTRQL
jgi:hypothetical protein